MAGPQAAHDHVEAIGKLGAECLLPAAAQKAQHEIWQQRAAERSDHQRLGQVAADEDGDTEGDDGPDHDDRQELAEPHRQPGLQHQAVDELEPRPIIAGAGEATLLAQLHQDILPVGLVLEQLEPTIDVLAIGAAGEGQEIQRLDEQRGRHSDQQIDKVDRVEVERHRGIRAAAKDRSRRRGS